jgi:hypothetical protein
VDRTNGASPPIYTCSSTDSSGLEIIHCCCFSDWAFEEIEGLEISSLADEAEMNKVAEIVNDVMAAFGQKVNIKKTEFMVVEWPVIEEGKDG